MCVSVEGVGPALGDPWKSMAGQAGGAGEGGGSSRDHRQLLQQ